MIGIGIIGCGIMGSDHASILMAGVPHARLVGVHDPSSALAAQVASRGTGVDVHDSPMRLISDAAIDAVLIASPDDTHARLVLACIDAGKPVLCEKPLASSVAECRQIVDAEVAKQQHLVQVGFMRRFDPGYRAMKRTCETGAHGLPLFLHCVHRNAVAPDYVTSDLVVTNSATHEIDIARYILGEEIAEVAVTSARRSRNSAARQPQFIVMQSESGVVVTVEVFLDAQYGYDVQAELVCEQGVVALTPPAAISTRASRISGSAVSEDWCDRFADAYRNQLREWVSALLNHRPTGSSAWDGYAVSVTAAAALDALKTQTRRPVRLEPRPALYQVVPDPEAVD